jgi:hypothetical protein
MLKKPDGNKLYIPDDVIANLLTEIHKQYNHIEMEKSYFLFKESFYHENGKNKLIQLIQKCPECQLTKISSTSCKSNWQITSTQQPEESIFIEYYGPMPKGICRFKYILVFINNFLKLTILYPFVKDTAKSTVIRINKLHITSRKAQKNNYSISLKRLDKFSKKRSNKTPFDCHQSTSSKLL